MNNSLKKNEEFKIKLYRIYKYLEDNNLDGVYLKKRSNFSWITCGGDNRIVDHSELGWSGILITKNTYYFSQTINNK